MIITWKITESGPTPGIAKRELPGIYKKAWKYIGEFWHRKFRGKHFTKEGAREYRYAPYSKGYEARKLREKGHTRPLVWSGLSEALTKVRDVRSTSKYGRVVLHAPQFNRLARMGRDMTTVSSRETRALKRAFVRKVEREMNAIRKKKITRIKS